MGVDNGEDTILLCFYLRTCRILYQLGF